MKSRTLSFPCESLLWPWLLEEPRGHFINSGPFCYYPLLSANCLTAERGGSVASSRFGPSFRWMDGWVAVNWKAIEYKNLFKSSFESELQNGKALLPSIGVLDEFSALCIHSLALSLLHSCILCEIAITIFWLTRHHMWTLDTIFWNYFNTIMLWCHIGRNLL